MRGFDGSVPFGADATYGRESGVLEAHWASGFVTQAVLREQNVLRDLVHSDIGLLAYLGHRHYWLTLEETNNLLSAAPIVLKVQDEYDFLLTDVVLKRSTEPGVIGTPARVIKALCSEEVKIVAMWHSSEVERDRAYAEEIKKRERTFAAWKAATAHVADHSLWAVRLTVFDDDDEGCWEQINIECPFCHAFSLKTEDEVGMACDRVDALDLILTCRTCQRTGLITEAFLRLEEG